MAAVAFAIGDRPALDAYEATEIAESLERRRNLAAVRLAAKIRLQVDKDPDRGDISSDVELDEHEAAALAALLDEPRTPEERPAFAYLRAQLARHRGE